MDEEIKLRLECVDIACRMSLYQSSNDLLEAAQYIYDFVIKNQTGDKPKNG